MFLLFSSWLPSGRSKETEAVDDMLFEALQTVKVQTLMAKEVHQKWLTKNPSQDKTKQNKSKKLWCASFWSTFWNFCTLQHLTMLSFPPYPHEGGRDGYMSPEGPSMCSAVLRNLWWLTGMPPGWRTMLFHVVTAILKCSGGTSCLYSTEGWRIWSPSKTCLFISKLFSPLSALLQKSGMVPLQFEAFNLQPSCIALRIFLSFPVGKWFTSI